LILTSQPAWSATQTAPWPKAMLCGLPRPVRLPTTWLVAGSILDTEPVWLRSSSLPVQTKPPPKVTTDPKKMGRAEIRARIRPVRASMRIRRPSNWVAHTEPAPTARSQPSAGRRVGVPTSRLEPGSMRETVHGSAGEQGLGPRLRTQTNPAPTATLKGCGSAMRTPTEGGPLGVAAGGWPVQPAVAAARSTTTASQRQPRSPLASRFALPRLDTTAASQRRYHGGGSIPSSRCEMAPWVHRPPSRGSAVLQARRNRHRRRCAAWRCPQRHHARRGTAPGQEP
jgi:hypothetical protein